MGKCGAKTSSGKPCRQAAGVGTSHPGVGRCRYHDDAAAAAADQELERKDEPGSNGIAAPSHLRPATAAWVEGICREYDLESHHQKLLQLAAEAWDRCQGAREVLDEKGVSYDDRFGQPKARPEVAVERDSRIGFARLLRELALDVEPPDDETPRPPPLKY